MPIFEPEQPPQIDQYMTGQQQALLALALALIQASPDKTGTVILTVNRGRLEYIQPTPSLKIVEGSALDAVKLEQATRWMRRLHTPFE